MIRKSTVAGVLSALCCAVPLATGPQKPASPAMPMGMPGLTPLEGTWAFPVQGGMHTRVLEGHTLPSSRGVDANALRDGSIHLTQTKPGPDLCDPSREGLAEFRVLSMTVAPGSRLIVNQALARASLYVYGEVREWVPADDYCQSRSMKELAPTRGFLRMSYNTQQHIVPLNFQAQPRADAFDALPLDRACDEFAKIAIDAYQVFNKRWAFLTSSFPGPIGGVPPPVPANTSNGEQGSLVDGTFFNRPVAEAAQTTTSLVGLAKAVKPWFEKAPRLAKGADQIAAWTLGEMVGEVGGQGIDGHAGNLIDMIKGAHEQYAGNPPSRNVADFAQGVVRHGGLEYPGLNVDYLVSTTVDVCERLQNMRPPEGRASGRFYWGGGGSIPMEGWSPAPGAPAAIATGQVGSMADVAKMMEMLKAQGIQIPDLSKLGALAPAGYNPAAPALAPMQGRAAYGKGVDKAAPEWNLSFVIDVADKPSKLASVWFDPRK